MLFRIGWNMHETEQLNKLLLVNLNGLLGNWVWFGARAHLPSEKRHMKAMQHDSWKLPGLRWGIYSQKVRSGAVGTWPLLQIWNQETAGDHQVASHITSFILKVVSKESKKLVKNSSKHCTIYSFNFTTPSFGSLQGKNATGTGHRHWKGTGEKDVSYQVQISSPSSRCLFCSYFSLCTLMLDVPWHSSITLQKAFALENWRQRLCNTPGLLNPSKGKQTGVTSQLWPSCTCILAARVNSTRLNLAVL